MTAEFYANVGKVKGTRDSLDVYETPGYVTSNLLAHITLKGPILEPAAGSGMISKVLRDAGLEVLEQDIRTGLDFREYKGPWRGDIVTNPPYGDGLAQFFVERALTAAKGRVAMLLRSGFLWSQGRRELFQQNPPELILLIPDRIYFFKRDGNPIPGQAHSHEWIVWPEKKDRGPDMVTRIEWADDLR